MPVLAQDTAIASSIQSLLYQMHMNSSTVFQSNEILLTLRAS
jgi:hypothetical protein